MERLVFAIEPNPRYDVSDAERYGHVAYLFAQNEHKPSVWSNAFLELCLNRLERNEYVPERDFLVVAGQMAPVVMLATHLVSMFDTVNLLYFDAANSEYVHKAVI